MVFNHHNKVQLNNMVKGRQFILSTEIFKNYR
jgi:hypothetical protein